MPIDPSIALGVKPIQVESPVNQLAGVLQIQNAQQSNQLNELKNAQMQDQFGRQNRLRSLLSGMGADATDDQRISALRGSGFFDEADKLDTSLMNRKKITSEADKNDMESTMKSVAGWRDVLGTATDAAQDAQLVQMMHTDPRMKNTPIAQVPLDVAISQIGTDPASFDNWKKNVALGATKFIEMNKPTYQETNSGKVKTMLALPGLGGPASAVNTTQMTTTPGEDLTDTRAREEGAANRGVQIRGQNMTDARARETLEATRSKPFEVTGADGNPVLVQQDKTGNITPVSGYSPKGGDKSLNDSQSKAALFGSRMKNADDILAQLADSGVTTSNPGANAGWGVGSVVGAMQGGKQQQLDQAKRDFVNAVLRRESGASISPTEFDSAEKQYFPSIGDSKETVAQKANARAIAIRGMLEEVPAGQRDKVVGNIIGKATKPSSGGFKYLGTE